MGLLREVGKSTLLSVLLNKNIVMANENIPKYKHSYTSLTYSGSESMKSNGEMGNKIGEFYWQNRIYQVQIRGEM